MIARRLAFVVWVSAWLLLAALIWAFAVPQQLARACWLAEWPFEEGCTEWPTGRQVKAEPEVYLEHVRRNIGDSHAYGALTRAWFERQDPRALQLLPAAKELAPYNPSLLVVQATAGLNSGDWETAAVALVPMLERGYGQAMKAVTAMMTTPQAQPALMAQLNADSRWLDWALASLDPKVPTGLVQGFFTEGSRLGVVRPETTLAMIDRLQAEGNWLDAYTLWVSLQKKVDEGLFNAGFDRQSTQRGFDWRWPQPATGVEGINVYQTSAAPNPGLMLEVELTGRGALPQPMVSQPMLLLDDRYTLSGNYMSDRMRTREGLVWALRCAGGGDRFAQSQPMKDTQRKWTHFEVDVRIPPQCGSAVRLQLESAAAWEAGAGMTGVMFFDEFELKPVSAARKP
ncbi:hypothetical protein [Piscinibacter sakaiensis]|uniref:hypothetical protein n=1 Tax=Piscinibacter sakaiensis TaxID=1547922 RepID=UPI003AAEAF78